MNKFLPITLGALLLSAGTAYFIAQNDIALPGVSAAVAQESSSSVDMTVDMAADMILGAEDAPVTFIVYSSFTCPHCATFHKGAFQELKTEFIDTGKVKFVHREVYFDRFGLWAGLVARCGGDEARYFGINDLIYEDQRAWIGSGDPQEVLTNLRRLGRTAGLNDQQINACLEDKEMAQSLVAAYQTNAEKHAINSTPSFVINGEKHSNMNFSDMSEIIEGLLAE